MTPGHTQAVSAELRELARFDDPTFIAQDPYPVFRRLRHEAPLYWYECDGAAFWAVTRHQDIREIGSNPQLFTSTKGVTIADLRARESGGIQTGTFLPPGVEFLVATDPPRHNELRQYISRGFTPRLVRDLSDFIASLAKETLDAVVPGVSYDLVETYVSPFPIYVIADLLGIPRTDWAQFVKWSDDFFAFSTTSADDPALNDLMVSIAEMWGYLHDIVEMRRIKATGDLISEFLAAEVKGERLTTDNVVMMCLLLLTAGNETSRVVIQGGMLALSQNPDQWQLLKADPGLMDAAVEEMLRWVSPVTCFGRTATQDVTVGDEIIREGDFCMLYYPSGNRDELIWGEDSEAFDIRRERGAPHVAFGWGQHVCPGAHLGRMEIKIFFSELVTRFSSIELSGPMERAPSLGFNGFTHVPITLIR